MFESLTERLNQVFRSVLGRGKLSDDNIAEAIGEIKTTLLEADVNAAVAAAFIDRVRASALGMDIVPGVSPGQFFIKVINDQLVSLLGGSNAGISWAASGPSVVMLCGLQGAGKTTTAAKLAHRWKAAGKRPLLVAADVQRPAAIEQLTTLGGQVGVPVFSQVGGDPVDICQRSRAVASQHQADVIILDTAGRLHLDDVLMQELEAINQAVDPAEILFVCDAMIGQSAVDTATEFRRRLPLTGAVLTKMDSDARGGAALSLREAAGVSIKFITTGEKLDALDEFYPDRMASRILGMGDVVSLVEKAQAVIDDKQAQLLQNRLANNAFDFNDFLGQMATLRQMGSLKDILGMIPGLGGALKGMDIHDGMYAGIESIIQSMTNRERKTPDIIDASRRQRIAKGSGRSVQEVNDLLKQFENMRRVTGRMGRLGLFSGGADKLMQFMNPSAMSALGSGRSLFGSKKKGTTAQKKKRDKKKRRR